MAFGAYKPGGSGIIELEPVREFTGDSRRLTLTLLQMLERERAVQAEQLAILDLQTFDEYRARRGKIEGLDIAINFCKEAQSKLEA
jgi:hypothetical protein